nr:protein trichome birefringence-like 3 [Ipomoea batatas]GMC79125.1 protein trichome birefringence-like 3 [Ipomoea batatas]GMC81795.1 protein trichome birefringence-like 3 [Ipomoea batatas]GMC90112.1 protein trichome birefringence-like 3 [Ipomoea batatas]
MMGVVSSVMKKMKVPVTFINITQLSEYRIDGHASIYNELGGKLLTDEQKADPTHYADCIHWCLPGVPDTWNQILYAYL